MKDKRIKTYTPLFLLLLVLILIAGGTVAYLMDDTEEVVNRITLSDIEEDLRAILTEPDWDGVIDYVYEDDGTITPVEEEDTGKTYGEEISDRILPGMDIPKNPFITNTSVRTNEWAAIKVWFVYGEGHLREGEPMDPADYIKVSDVVSLDYNLDDWELIAGGQIDSSGKVADDSSLSPYKEFYYKKKLNKGTENSYGETTTPLFTKVSVDPKGNNEQFESLRDLYGFVVYVEGFVAQAVSGDTYESFKEWGVAGGVHYTNSPAVGSPVDIRRPGITGKPVND